MTHSQPMPAQVKTERTLSSGSTIRLVLEAQGDEQVKIVEYHRKSRRSERFQRVKGEEGQVVDFAKLRLNSSYGELFQIA